MTDPISINGTEAPALGTVAAVTEVVKTTIEMQAEIDKLTQQVGDLQLSLQQATRLRDLYTDKFNSAQRDWNKLNEFINAYADESDMCSTYENRLSEWNDSFSIFSLEGRVKEYEVSVRVTATYYTTVTVEANSDDHAQDLVGDMDLDDIENNSGFDWKYPDDSDFDITDVNIA